MDNESISPKAPQDTGVSKQRNRHPKPWRMAIGMASTLVTIVLLAGLYIFTASPAAIRKPTLEHYHFRLQILINGEAENLGADKYQTPYDKNACTADLTPLPIHLHDNKDQMVHIHWNHMTGGLVLKNYGWPQVGGIPNALGYRFDQSPKPVKVPIYGAVLPQLPKDAKLYVFSGDEAGFKERTLDDFLYKDLEEFFEKRSNMPEPDAASFLDRLFPRALAHEGHDHTEEALDTTELLEMNNLLGNVVIFAQKDRPTDQEVTERFNKLVPLEPSTCGG